MKYAVVLASAPGALAELAQAPAARTKVSTKKQQPTETPFTKRGTK